MNQVVNLTNVDQVYDKDPNKNTDAKPLKEISEGMKNVMRWGNILGIPLLFSAYGIYRKWQRKNQKKFQCAHGLSP